MITKGASLKGTAALMVTAIVSASALVLTVCVWSVNRDTVAARPLEGVR